MGAALEVGTGVELRSAYLHAGGGLAYNQMFEWQRREDGLQESKRHLVGPVMRAGLEFKVADWLGLATTVHGAVFPVNMGGFSMVPIVGFDAGLVGYF